MQTKGFLFSCGGANNIGGTGMAKIVLSSLDGYNPDNNNPEPF